jgi:hypothetical protein
MLILTAGSDHGTYASTIRFCEAKCKEFGYKFKVYDLGGLGFGIPIDDPRLTSEFRIMRYSIKPELILKTLNSTDEEFVVWIDGDAMLVERIDELEADDSFDVGVTVRPSVVKKKSNYINAGVLFFKNNAASKHFLQEWMTAMGPPPFDAKERPSGYCDQVNLEEKILLPAIGVPLWDIIGSVHEIDGTRVKLLDCNQYNNFFSHGIEPYHDPSMKVIHFKGRHWRSCKPRWFEGELMTNFEMYRRRFLSG